MLVSLSRERRTIETLEMRTSTCSERCQLRVNDNFDVPDSENVGVANLATMEPCLSPMSMDVKNRCRSSSKDQLDLLAVVILSSASQA